MPKTTHIGQRIKYFRRLKGLTQNELAIAAKTSRPLITNLERERRDNIMLDTAARIAHALAVTLDQLYGFDMLGNDEEG